MGGRVRRRLNNVLIHLHIYTADRYRGGGILYCCWGGGGFGGRGGIRGVNQLTRVLSGWGLGRRVG